MKILIIITGHNINEYSHSIKKLYDYFNYNYPNDVTDYACISSSNVTMIEQCINIKYKEIDTSQQLTKVCNFITKYYNELDYDWFIKVRPEIIINDKINFEELNIDSINARAREYIGPKRLLYGNSVNGDGKHKLHNASTYNINEQLIILDDQLYIFHRKIIDSGAFNNTMDEKWFTYNNIEHEWYHSCCWKSRNIQVNVIDINLVLRKNNGEYFTSGRLN